ncbi:hypothetical protein AGMMS49921_08520 [Endomicrobiia bacterium]|nr:hypothetical protein AGMMS49921_08520 [Endomicrobiia bacterium]
MEKEKENLERNKERLKAEGEREKLIDEEGDKGKEKEKEVDEQENFWIRFNPSRAVIIGGIS